MSSVLDRSPVRSLLAGALLVGVLAACSSGGGTTTGGDAGAFGFPQASQDAAAPITVWSTPTGRPPRRPSRKPTPVCRSPW